MDSTSKRKKKSDSSEHRSFLNKVFGGEFLLKEEMRPWYGYTFFVLVLSAILVVSEQRINEKKEVITLLENKYKAELSNLKANNQFIPYEENQILINKMLNRGFLLNEEDNFTIVVKKPLEEKRHFRWFKKTKKSEKEQQNDNIQ